MQVETKNKCEHNRSLVFDEMSLKQHIDYDKKKPRGKLVNQVLLLTVHGLSTKWEQPNDFIISLSLSNYLVPK